MKGTLAGEQRGWRTPGAGGTFRSDRASEPPLTDAQLRAQAATRRAGADLHLRPAGLRRRASASTATRTASSTATSSTPAATRPIRRARRAAARPRRRRPRRRTSTTSTTIAGGADLRPDPDQEAHAEGPQRAARRSGQAQGQLQVRYEAGRPPRLTSRRRHGTVPTIRAPSARRSRCTTRSPRAASSCPWGFRLRDGARSASNAYKYKGASDGRDHAGDPQARPDRVQGRQGGVELHAERAVAGARRGGAPHRHTCSTARTRRPRRAATRRRRRATTASTSSSRSRTRRRRSSASGRDRPP